MKQIFKKEICNDCQGKKYPRQCRNSKEWRQDKVSRYDDIKEIDFDCPFGVELNFLPVSKEIPIPKICPYRGKTIRFKKRKCCGSIEVFYCNKLKHEVESTKCKSCKEKD